MKESIISCLQLNTTKIINFVSFLYFLYTRLENKGEVGGGGLFERRRLF